MLSKILPNKRKYGLFLSIELIIIIFIIGGVALVAVAAVGMLMRNYKVSGIINEVNTFSEAAQKFHATFGVWPGDLSPEKMVGDMGYPGLIAAAKDASFGYVKNAQIFYRNYYRINKYNGGNSVSGNFSQVGDALYATIEGYNGCGYNNGRTYTNSSGSTVQATDYSVNPFNYSKKYLSLTTFDGVGGASFGFGTGLVGARKTQLAVPSLIAAKLLPYSVNQNIVLGERCIGKTRIIPATNCLHTNNSSSCTFVTSEIQDKPVDLEFDTISCGSPDSQASTQLSTYPLYGYTCLPAADQYAYRSAVDQRFYYFFGVDSCDAGGANINPCVVPAFSLMYSSGLSNFYTKQVSGVPRITIGNINGYCGSAATVNGAVVPATLARAIDEKIDDGMPLTEGKVFSDGQYYAATNNAPSVGAKFAYAGVFAFDPSGVFMDDVQAYGCHTLSSPSMFTASNYKTAKYLNADAYPSSADNKACLVTFILSGRSSSPDY